LDMRGSPSAASLFASFFRVGAFTFGGGVAMLPVIEREIVEHKQWLSTEEFVDVLAIAQSGPGAIAINTAILTGHKLLGLRGVAAATAGVVAPSFLIILVIAALLPQAGQSPILNGFFMGVRPAIVALIAAAAIKLGRKILVDQFSILLAGITLAISLLLNPHPAVLVPAAALIGLGRFFYLRKREQDSPS